jgi:hypothetical protein
VQTYWLQKQILKMNGLNLYQGVPKDLAPFTVLDFGGKNRFVVVQSCPHTSRKHWQSEQTLDHT